MKPLYRIAFLLVLSFVCSTSLIAQQYKWVKGGGTGQNLSTQPNDEAVYYSCTDHNGNVYALSVVGNFPIVADTFSRPTGAFGSPQNLLLTSYNCSGQMRWAKLIGSAGGECYPFGLTADSDGHIYIAGYLGHIGGAHTLYIGYDTSISGSIYQSSAIVQFDTNGHFNWVGFIGDNTPATNAGQLSRYSYLAVDSSDNVHFFSSLKYGVPVTPSLTSNRGMYDIVFDQTGNQLSAKRFALDSTLDIMGAALDKQSGKAYLFGNRNAGFPGTIHIFIAAFDTARQLIWKDTLMAPGFEGSESVLGVIPDEIGNLYLSITGPRAVVYRNDTFRNVYSPTLPYYLSTILKTDTAGNVNWSKTYSANSGINMLFGLALMPNNKIAAAGVMGGRLKSGMDSIVTYSGEGQNSHFTILDSAGNLHWLEQIHGDGFYDRANSVTSDRVGNLYIGGQVENSTWAGTIPAYFSAGGNTDFYLMKFGVDCSCTSMPISSFTATGTHTVGFTYTGTMTGIDSVVWTFGDGSRGTGTAIAHTYSTTGTYHVCARVYTGCGSDLFCNDLTLSCAAPVASLIDTGMRVIGVTYTGTTPFIDSLVWTFGDGGTATGTTALHTYTAVGIYTVCVTAHSFCGVDSACTFDTVVCVSAPVASFTDTGTHTIGCTYTGTTAGMDSVVWSFGDGYTATGLTAIHTFSAPATYHVCVTVYTKCGSDSSCHDVVVTIPSLVSAINGTGQRISVYPNPARDRLMISGLSQAANYRFLNITGTTIMDGSLQQGTNILTLFKTAPGLYLLELEQDHIKSYIKIIIE